MLNASSFFFSLIHSINVFVFCSIHRMRLHFVVFVALNTVVDDGRTPPIYLSVSNHFFSVFCVISKTFPFVDMGFFVVVMTVFFHRSLLCKHKHTRYYSHTLHYFLMCSPFCERWQNIHSQHARTHTHFCFFFLFTFSALFLPILTLILCKHFDSAERCSSICAYVFFLVSMRSMLEPFVSFSDHGVLLA